MKYEFSPSSLRLTTALSLTIGLLLSPVMAFADGMIQLKPMMSDQVAERPASRNQDSNIYNGTGVTSSYSNLDNLNGNTNYNANNTSYTPSNTSNLVSNNSSSVMLQGRLVSIPKGTLLSAHTDFPVSSFGTHTGDPVNATLESDVFVNDTVAIPAGSQVLGQIATVEPAGRLGKHGMIDIRFDSVKLPGGRVVPLNAHVVTKDKSGVLKGDTYTMDILKGVGIAAGSTAVGVVGGTAAGSLLGSVGTGAVFGLGVGALGGLGYAMMRKGKEVIVPAGSRMSLMIDTPISFSN